MPFLSSLVFMDPARTPHTIELLAAAQRLANFSEMRMKFGLACKRPVEFSVQVQPMIPTPTHGTLPGRHATEAFTLSQVLWLVLREAWGIKRHDPAGEHALRGEMMMRQAESGFDGQHYGGYDDFDWHAI